MMQAMWPNYWDDECVCNSSFQNRHTYVINATYTCNYYYVQKMDEPTETPYGGLTHVGPRKHVLDEGTDTMRRGTFEGACASAL